MSSQPGRNMFKGSIPALVTPMRDDGSLDLDGMGPAARFSSCRRQRRRRRRRHDRRITDASPRDELATLIGRAKTRVAGRMPVIAGSGGNSTARSVALSRAAVEAGADALLVVTPYYNRPTQEGLLPAFHGHRGRGGRAGDPLQRAVAHVVRSSARDRRATRGASADRRDQGSDRRRRAGRGRTASLSRRISSS